MSALTAQGPGATLSLDLSIQTLPDLCCRLPSAQPPQLCLTSHYSYVSSLVSGSISVCFSLYGPRTWFWPLPCQKANYRNHPTQFILPKTLASCILHRRSCPERRVSYSYIAPTLGQPCFFSALTISSRGSPIVSSLKSLKRRNNMHLNFFAEFEFSPKGDNSSL